MINKRNFDLRKGYEGVFFPSSDRTNSLEIWGLPGFRKMICSAKVEEDHKGLSAYVPTVQILVNY